MHSGPWLPSRRPARRAAAHLDHLLGGRPSVEQEPGSAPFTSPLERGAKSPPTQGCVASLTAPRHDGGGPCYVPATARSTPGVGIARRPPGPSAGAPWHAPRSRKTPASRVPPPEHASSSRDTPRHDRPLDDRRRRSTRRIGSNRRPHGTAVRTDGHEPASLVSSVRQSRTTTGPPRAPTVGLSVHCYRGHPRRLIRVSAAGIALALGSSGAQGKARCRRAMRGSEPTTAPRPPARARSSTPQLRDVSGPGASVTCDDLDGDGGHVMTRATGSDAVVATTDGPGRANAATPPPPADQPERLSAWQLISQARACQVMGSPLYAPSVGHSRTGRPRRGRDGRAPRAPGATGAG